MNTEVHSLENNVRPPILQLVNVHRQFGDFTAVGGISLDIREGEFLTIVGPSGSGKTTMLKMLAGMDAPTSGNITLRGELINHVPARLRPTALVFQSLALFPHKTVGENIEFPLKVKKVPADQRKERALELLAMLRLPEHYYSKNILQCSGGERQRVALARAFAYDPDVLLFDEPLSALDYKLKKVLEKELKDLHRKSGKTFIYITHSLEEAMVMCDRIAVMRGGKIVQVGTPETIYATPADDFVAEFFGEVNKFAIDFSHAKGWLSAETGQALNVDIPEKLGGVNSAVAVVRPEYMHFVEEGQHFDNQWQATVFNEYSLGSRIQYQVRCGKAAILVEVPRTWGGKLATGDTVTIGFNRADVLVAGA